jgi:hypothetical protein
VAIFQLRLSENAHLPFGRLTALSKAEGPFDKLMALSKAEASKGCVTLILRDCDVLLCTPHSSGFVRASLGLPTLDDFVD